MPLTLCLALNTHSWRIPSTGQEGVFPHHSRSLFHHLQMLFSNTDHDSALARLAGFQIPHIFPWELNSGLSFPIRTKVIEYHLATDLCATIGILERLLYILVSLLYTSTHSESGRQRVVLGDTWNQCNYTPMCVWETSQAPGPEFLQPRSCHRCQSCLCSVPPGLCLLCDAPYPIPGAEAQLGRGASLFTTFSESAPSQRFLVIRWLDR